MSSSLLTIYLRVTFNAAINDLVVQQKKSRSHTDVPHLLVHESVKAPSANSVDNLLSLFHRGILRHFDVFEYAVGDQLEVLRIVHRSIVTHAQLHESNLAAFNIQSAVGVKRSRDCPNSMHNFVLQYE